MNTTTCDESADQILAQNLPKFGQMILDINDYQAMLVCNIPRCTIVHLHRVQY
jgi:hypothetical protein